LNEIVAVDIGGTHARFAIAEVANGRVLSVAEACTLKTGVYASLQTAWEEFQRRTDRPLPRAAGIALAAPVRGDLLKLTNNSWLIRPSLLPEKLGLERYRIVNDLGAAAFAVTQLGPDHFRHLYGPDRPLPEDGIISIIGPGTGLGVSQLLLRAGHRHVIETEGGHIDFAPIDGLEDRILALLRGRYRRVSVERLTAGMGLPNIYEALATLEGRPARQMEDKALWQAALDGTDSLAVAALERYFLCLGSVAGDLALAHGASAVVIAGGLGQRLADHFANSGFHDRFTAKGRYERDMNELPVKLITHPQPGLFGAAAAYAERFED
jgi:glucokinase